MPCISIQNADKRFKTPEGKVFEVLNGVNLDIEEGEFVSIIGHSGCGKSTLLNMVGGFLNCDGGTITVGGTPVKGPGPDRMFVFQNHSLLPWLTVRENVRLSVDAVHKQLTNGERAALVDEHLNMVSLTPAATKLPGKLSDGMKQRVGIAQALVVKPRVLMLDEPFGALDVLTRGRLQELLLEIWEAHRITVMMVTHDVEEALLLSDRIVMMTIGPAATIGEVYKVPFPRPRSRTGVSEDPHYYTLGNQILKFLYERFSEPALAE
jgi:nitrate ABC transporter ATP-binding subunit